MLESAEWEGRIVRLRGKKRGPLFYTEPGLPKGRISRRNVERRGAKDSGPPGWVGAGKGPLLGSALTAGVDHPYPRVRAAIPPLWPDAH